MLWTAGQERTVRESRDRLAELYVATRDASMDVLVRSGQAKPTGAWQQPAYLPQSKGEPGDELKERDKAFAELARMFPSAVRRADS